MGFSIGGLLPIAGGVLGGIFGGPAGAAAGASIGGGLGGMLASNQAAGQQQAGAQAATQAQYDFYNQNQRNAQPYMDAGRTALGQIGDQYGYFNHQFGPEDLRNGLSPNYDFMLGQGLRGVGNAANTAGSRLGGNALAGLTRYAEDYAGNAYQNAFNNYNSQRSDIFNRLSSIAGLGENASQHVGNAGSQAASNIGASLMGGANAAAAGTVGSMNALNNGIGNYLGWNYLNQRPGGAPSGGGYLGGSGSGWEPGGGS